MQQIPVQPLPSQVMNITLANQNCTIKLYQLSTGLYCDLHVGSELIIGGVICENLNRIVRDLYLGFVGDLGFYDMQGTDNPYYTGLGTRFIFIYLTKEDLAGNG